MDVIIRGLAILGAIFAIGAAIYLYVQILKMKKTHKKSQYIKNKEFLLMKNDGENPCDTQCQFVFPEFSQCCGYIVQKGGFQ